MQASGTPTRALRRSLGRAAPAPVRRLWETRVSAETLRALDRVALGPRPIVVGPWLSEVGFELLYWLPLLHWFVERHAIPREDVVAVSRGGVSSWYADVAAAYVEVFDEIDAADVARLRQERVAAGRSEKQGAVGDDDRRLLEAVRQRLSVAETSWLHPSLMYRLYNVAWAWTGDLQLVLRHSRFRPLPPPGPPPPELPSRYVAVKAYWSACLPDRHENRRFLRDLLEQLAARAPVVLLRTGLELDDHDEPAPGELPEGVIDAAPLLAAPATNLAVQTRIVGGADELVSTYGGFAYLGPLLGVPTRSFFSIRKFNPLHERVLEAVAAALGTADAASLAPRPVTAFRPDR